MSVTSLIYEAAGSPSMLGLEPTQGMCWLCGSDLAGQGVPYQQFVKDTFTDHDKVKCATSSHVCSACCFCHDERNELLMRLTGKDKLQRMRNYSHFVADGQWVPLSKGAKGRMRELLPRATVAVIADSGQKHIIFRARPGCWQFEETSIWPDVATLDELSTAVAELYTAFNKSEIAGGDYAAHRIRQFGLSRWRELETAIKPHRGGVIFDLAIYLAQKEEGENGDWRVSRPSSEDSAGGPPVDELGRVGHEATQVLVDPDRQRAQRGLHKQPAEVHQLVMFQDADSEPRP